MDFKLGNWPKKAKNFKFERLYHLLREVDLYYGYLLCLSRKPTDFKHPQLERHRCVLASGWRISRILQIFDALQTLCLPAGAAFAVPMLWVSLFAISFAAPPR